MKQRGFTMLELLVCASLSIVLLGLAVPSYRGAVLKARRHEARIALYRLQTLQERHFFDHSRYAARVEDLHAVAASDSGHYALALLTSADGQHYALAATPLGPQADDGECSRITLDEQGVRGATGATDAVDRCWR